VLECLELEDPLARMVEMARRYAAWGIAHPNHYRLMLVPPPSWSADSERSPGEAEPPLEHEVLAVLNVAVTDAIKRGVLRDKYTEPSAVAATLWAGIHGLVLLEITMTSKERKLIGKVDLSFEERFETLKQVFLDGFLKA
ncbi:MAG: WHG domain-containing protein, partial [Candidatus Hydrogenedentes bacterium]|nr:WHG domain-containing protein [Candidatus Hydrogenedentota bacterium]